jgi:hypothetical protein
MGSTAQLGVGSGRARVGIVTVENVFVGDRGNVGERVRGRAARRTRKRYFTARNFVSLSS